MMRSSNHLIFANVGKRESLRILIAEYRKLTQEIIDDVWENGYEDFCVSRNQLYLPTFAKKEYLHKFKTTLSSRITQCAAKQAFGMIRAAVNERANNIKKISYYQRKGEDVSAFQRKVDNKRLVKPSAAKINLDLDSRFIDFRFGTGHHFAFIRLSSFRAKGVPGFRYIKIPVGKNKTFHKWNEKGTLLNFLRVSEKRVEFVFSVPEAPKNETGAVIGADQGVRTTVTTSDGRDPGLYQGRYTLDDILDMLTRRVPGSKGFRKAQEFRRNYINWFLNALDLSDIRELRYEHVKYLRFKKSHGRKISHWTYTLIKAKLISLSEEKGFRFVEVAAPFRSQRCSECGYVHIANRKSKAFICRECGHAADADMNAAQNILLDLCEVPKWVCYGKYNRKGFFWSESGIFSHGQEPLVPDTKKHE